MVHHSQNGPHSAISQNLSGDFVNCVENVIMLITVALWEICFRMFSFLQIHEGEGLLSYHGNRKRILIFL